MIESTFKRQAWILEPSSDCEQTNYKYEERKQTEVWRETNKQTRNKKREKERNKHLSRARKRANKQTISMEKRKRTSNTFKCEHSSSNTLSGDQKRG